jgi:hypothetical protein
MKMKAGIGVTMLMLLGTLCPFQLASASDLFYAGDIVIDSVSIEVEADGDATVYAAYLLTNRGSEEEEIDLHFAQCPVSLEANGEELSNPVVFGPGERKSINLACKLNITGETTKMLSLNPTMLFNGKPNSMPARGLLIRVLLPEGVRGLAWANQEPDEEGVQGSRRFYSWSGVDIYPTTLCLKWSTLQVELSVEKHAAPQEITTRDQIMNLEITVQNKGETPVNNIALVDQYLAVDFERAEPLWEFVEREGWLFWTRNIPLLGPGETMTLAYSVRYTGFSSQDYDFDLRPTVVTVGGHLVCVSNKLRMSQRGGAAPVPTGQEEPIEPEAESLRFPSLPLLGGIILILAAARGGYLIWRWRHTR